MRTLILLTLLFLACSSRDTDDRAGGLAAAKFAANHVMDVDMVRVALKGYVENGILVPGDSVMADDSLALVYISYSGSIVWVRLRNELRDGEKTWTVFDNREVMTHEVIARRIGEKEWVVERSAW